MADLPPGPQFVPEAVRFAWTICGAAMPAVAAASRSRPGRRRSHGVAAGLLRETNRTAVGAAAATTTSPPRSLSSRVVFRFPPARGVGPSVEPVAHGWHRRRIVRVLDVQRLDQRIGGKRCPSALLPRPHGLIEAANSQASDHLGNSGEIARPALTQTRQPSAPATT